jgi:hypothetical protein
MAAQDNAGILELLFYFSMGGSKTVVLVFWSFFFFKENYRLYIDYHFSI